MEAEGGGSKLLLEGGRYTASDCCINGVALSRTHTLKLLYKEQVGQGSEKA